MVELSSTFRLTGEFDMNCRRRICGKQKHRTGHQKIGYNEYPFETRDSIIDISIFFFAKPNDPN